MNVRALNIRVALADVGIGHGPSSDKTFTGIALTARDDKTTHTRDVYRHAGAGAGRRKEVCKRCLNPSCRTQRFFDILPW